MELMGQATWKAKVAAATERVREGERVTIKKAEGRKVGRDVEP
jgi:hypothetical protein